MNRLISFVRSLRRDAVIESGKIMFALIGVGTVGANAWVAGKILFLPVLAVFLAAWYCLYLQMGAQ